MNLFRSEEHIYRWLGSRTPGATIGVSRLNALAGAWWHDRLSPDWHPRTPDQGQRILDELGLDSEFWRLRPSG